MIRLMKNKFGLLASVVFLLTIVLKPIHQLSHLEKATPTAAFDLNSAHFQEIDHCQVCDFQFTPGLELDSLPIEIPLLVSFVLKEVQIPIHSNYAHVQALNLPLRAPPF